MENHLKGKEMAGYACRVVDGVRVCLTYSEFYKNGWTQKLAKPYETIFGHRFIG